jgi:hypothetical protein
LHLERAQG